MISVSIARKYAKALLRIGLKEKNHEALGRDLDKFHALLQEKKQLRGLLFNVFYRPARRKAMAREIGKFLGLNKITMDFIDLLIDRERMDHFPAVVQSYREL
ncbi:MAG TPA: F0F1 ATP synthase subunit delta, partial [Thermodesulfobacteriota bacterium]|nr:F0F1 ATP synthase subunit delta [Thermodesulfobacteriota bacterium]